MNEQDVAQYWRQRARRLVWRINAGWCLQRFLPLALAGCLLAALLVLVVRSTNGPVLPVALGLVLWLVGSGFWAWLRARPFFVAHDAGLARLDAAEHLYNRLVSADAGIGTWPTPTERSGLRLRWEWRRIAMPVTAGCAALLVASFAPMRVAEPERPSAIQEPSSWRAVESSIEWLQEDRIVREEVLDRLVDQLDALRSRPREEWYRQSTMEASDHLREQVGLGARELQHAMERAAAALELALRDGAQLSESQRSALQELFQEALDAMEHGPLPLSEEMLAALKDLDLSNLPSLTDQELQDLLDRLQEQGECLAQCAAACQMGGGEGAMDGASGMPGTDGEGDTALTFRERDQMPQPVERMAVSNPDLSRAAIGDRLGIAVDEHEVDETAYQGAVAAGAVASPGSGGEAVWRMQVAPREQHILRAYFE